MAHRPTSFVCVRPAAKLRLNGRPVCHRVIEECDRVLDRSAEEPHDAEQQIRLLLGFREAAEQGEQLALPETANDSRSYIGDTPCVSRAANSA